LKMEQIGEMGKGRLNRALLFFVMVTGLLVGRAACFAETVVLSWDANSESDLSGYKVHYKADSSTLPFDGAGAGEGGSPVDVHNLTTATISGLDPGRTYYFAVTAYNTTGIESAYSNIVTVLESVPPAVSPGSPATKPPANGTVPIAGDTIAPVVSLTAPGNNSSVSGTVVITATASDNVGVSMVEFYRNGALLFASNVAPYTFNWNTSAVANGGCTLMAAAYDSAGNIKQSASVSVAVNNTIPDVTAPLLGSFTLPTTAASMTVPVSALTASDSVGVTGYLITASATVPAASASGWSASAPASFTFSSGGTKTAYAWAKDAAGNVSGSRAATTTIALTDTTAPLLGSFTLPTTAASLTVPVSVFTASDSVGVTGYLITASATVPAASASGWSASAPASFTFASAGTKSAYAWAKDAAGNVSSGRAATTTITLTDTTAPALGSFSLPATAASLTVPVSRLSASDSIGVTGYLITESAVAPPATASGWSASAPASFTFTSAGTKTAYAWAKDAAGNVSGSRAATTTIILPDTSILTLTDALLALQIGTGKVTPTVGQMSRLDVAPVVNGISIPDGVVNTGDAIVLLSKIVGKPIM
jgi:hypothetical protein